MWGLIDNLAIVPNKYKADIIKNFVEGTKKETLTTRYERNPKARQPV
ncbi:hypothetical protein [Lysinibacillus fusiformis]|nr:hypothetical protein [Lysinibacillus fusiformis]